MLLMMLLFLGVAVVVACCGGLLCWVFFGPASCGDDYYGCSLFWRFVGILGAFRTPNRLQKEPSPSIRA